MPGDPLSPDVSRLVTPRRPEPAATPAPDYLVDMDSSTRPVRVADFEDCSWWGGAENPDTAPPRPGRHDTPLPDRKIDWAAVAAVGEEPIVALQSAPCPCGAGQTMAGRSWCLRCGYDSDLDLLRKAERRAAAEPARRVSREWRWLVRSAPVLVLAVFVTAAIVAATAYRREFVPDRTELRVWWTGIEAAVGALLYLVAHTAALVLTVRYWKDAPPSLFDPISVWRCAAAHLPRTQWAFVLGLWGATAFGCAFVLFWMNDYAFKDKTAKAPPRHIDAPAKPNPAAGRPGDSREDGPAIINTGSGNGRKPAADSGPTAPPAAPPLVVERTQSTTAVVIGYVPDPADPSKVGRLALGTRSADGTIRFAGYADVDKTTDGLGQVAGLKRLVVTPDYVTEQGIVPVEPTLTADVKFAERDAQGVLRNSLATAVGGEKKGN